MAEKIISMVLFFNIALVILFFIMKIHRHTVDRARRNFTESTRIEGEVTEEPDSASSGCEKST